jgi:GR25 family glycosyltransferase involved in LPS biosynthesis
MDCRYINLEAATSRRDRLERNFSQHARAHWSLHRFAAVDAAEVRASGIEGRLAPPAMACFLSHRRLIEASLADERPIFVLEDDAAFGGGTCETIDRFLRDDSGLGWDIAFTDVSIPFAHTMIELIRLRRQWAATGQVTRLDLSRMAFGGSTAYLVNGRSKRKLAELLGAVKRIDVPYDLELRNLIRETRLAGFVFFPFITSLSELSEVSQVQPNDAAATDLIWNTFRQLIWLDRNVDRQQAALADIESRLCDEESRLFAPIFAAMTAQSYRSK